MGNPVVHFEIYGDDDSALRRFYSETFGWKMGIVPDDSYAMIDTGTGIRGGIAKKFDNGPGVMFYIQVPDINKYLDRITAAGGSVLLERTVSPVVITAMARDPEGNVIGLTEEQPAAQVDRQVH